VTEPDPTVILERIAGRILRLRGENVMLDADLAALYGVETRALTQAVRRHSRRFPLDFMFQLTPEEAVRSRCQSGNSSDPMGSNLRSQSVISSDLARGVGTVYHVDIDGESSPCEAATLRSQSVTSSAWGGRRYLPYAFTEQGVAMLASVLGSERAIQANIAIIRAFVRMRQVLASNADLAAKLDDLEQRYDRQSRAVFDAIRALMREPERPSRPLGFRPDDG